MIDSLPLLKNRTEWSFLVLFLFFVFTFNIFYEYSKFQDFKNEEIYQANATIMNIYDKRRYQILKLQTENFSFFTSVSRDEHFNKLDNVNISIVTKKVDFVGYLRGFYTTSFNIKEIPAKDSILVNLSQKVQFQHKNQQISQLFNALFFAIPIDKELRKQCANFGVSHLIAISGFHLGVLSFVIYWIFYFPYSYIHGRYFPYRNKKFDLLVLSMIILFGYLIFTGVVPSLLRAFVMFVFGIYFLHSNIKIISFETLLLVFLFVVAFFPKYLFSLSLWLSVAGVFYIFLFLKYFKNMNKAGQFLLFNIWIYLAMNPVAHYFFGATAYSQLFSPVITLGFTIFYPIELFAHIIGQGGFLDSFIEAWLSIKTTSIEILTPSWFFYIYLLISLLSIKYYKFFKTLNLAFLAFGLWLFV